MPITTANIEFRPSITTGSRGNSLYQGNVNNALGKYISTSGIVDNTLDNLFNDLSGPNNASGVVDYRCAFLLNNHATLTYQNALVWIDLESTAICQIGLDPAGVTAVDSSSVQAATIVDSLHQPAGVTFTKPLSQGAGLSIGNMVASGCQAIWIQRSGVNSAAINNDSCRIGFTGDTAA